ncbi:hypothetical protein DBR43_04885 [Pedobacter sp. KBW06]|uniref:hypothetical protein n=1 Tax=Pedobacter sp. KBW06 TaxID=2153359 RepID=UPI000F5B6E03|nr:hypothetical protein [Pedobacter sp. KBW06]RQO74723.1 hypothetical protein DBR43_04885 [Pedobacter sp. KBW06]
MQLHDFLSTIITLLKEHSSLFKQLADRQNNSPQPLQLISPPKDEILDLKQFRDLMNIGPSTYRRRILDGTFVPKLIGGKKYFLKSEIEHLIRHKENKKPKKPK